MAKKKGGDKKKGKGGKKVSLLTDDAALAPFECKLRDMIQTPLGVQCEVIGVKDGVLWLRWPGKLEAPAPPTATNKAELNSYGYFRRPASAHIQRSIDERARANYEQRWYGAPGPKTAALKLPMPSGSPAFSAFSTAETAKRAKAET